MCFGSSLILFYFVRSLVAMATLYFLEFQKRSNNYDIPIQYVFKNIKSWLIFLRIEVVS